MTDGVSLIDNFNYLKNVNLKRTTVNTISSPYNPSTGVYPETEILRATTEKLLVYNVMGNSLQSYASVPQSVILVRLYNADGTLKFVSNTVGVYQAFTEQNSSLNRFAAFNDVNQGFPLLEVGEYLTAQVRGASFDGNATYDGMEMEFKTFYKFNLPEGIRMAYRILDTTDTTSIFPLYSLSDPVNKKNLISLFDLGSRSNDMTITSQDTVPGSVTNIGLRVYQNYNPAKNSTFFVLYEGDGAPFPQNLLGSFAYGGFYGFNTIVLRNTLNTAVHPRLVGDDSVAVQCDSIVAGQPPSIVAFAVLYEF
jgi:hypothetical protein